MKYLVTAEERRAQLWEIAREQLEAGFALEGEVSGQGSVETRRDNDWQDLEGLHEQLAHQDASTSGNRRQWTSQQIDLGKAEEAQLKEDAERLAKRLGVREKVVDPTTNLIATLTAQSKGERKQRTRVRGNSGSGKSKERKLLHVGSLIQSPNEDTGLGPKKVTVARPTGAQVGFAVIS